MQIASKNPRADCSPTHRDEDVDNDDEDQRTLFCANLSELVTEELLYELFIQCGPVESVRIPKDKDGRPRQFGFVTFAHVCSVPYTVELLTGVRLFHRDLVIKNRNTNSRNQTLGKRRRIDSTSLSGDRTSPPATSRPRREETSRDTKREYQSNNSLRSGGQNRANNGRFDPGMQPNKIPPINATRTHQSPNNLNLDNLAALGADLFCNASKVPGANLFGQALHDAFNANSTRRSFGDNDRSNRQHNNPFRSAQPNNLHHHRGNPDQKRGRHDNRDRPSNNQQKRRR